MVSNIRFLSPSLIEMPDWISKKKISTVTPKTDLSIMNHDYWYIIAPFIQHFSTFLYVFFLIIILKGQYVKTTVNVSLHMTINKWKFPKG